MLYFLKTSTMGFSMKGSICSWAKNQQTPKPTATAATERMMHLRSSSRCWKRLIEPICRNSRSISLCSGSATRSDIGILRDGILHALCQAVEGALYGEVLIAGDFGDLRLQVFTGIRFVKFEFSDFFMNLALEFIAGPFELCHEFAPGAGEFR